MTLNSKGLLPCPFCGSKNVAQGASRDMISVWCFCGAQGPSVPFPEINPEPIVAIHECFTAWNRRALPPVDGLEVVAELNRIIAEEAADFADAAGHAVEAGERPDLWDREVEVSVHTLSQASSVIAGLKEANEALLSTYERGRKEGIEEAAKVAASGKIYAHVTTGEPPTVWPIEHRDLIATTIRQLLEVKSEDSVEKTEKT